MRNIRIDLRYDGTDFAGWQVQPGLRTVQGVIEEVLAVFLRQPVRLHGAGRTDAGVHALRQVAHFRTASHLGVETIGRALRGLLPNDVLLVGACEVPRRFDARRDALSRSYRYRIVRGRDPLAARYAWEVERPLDTARIAGAARSLAGPIDATALAASTRKGRDNRVRIDRSDVVWGEKEIRYEVEANRFVHHMVRNIVGTLVEIGRGAMEPDIFPDLLAARDRCRAGPTAPARGLHLVEVRYAPGGAASESEGGDR